MSFIAGIITVILLLNSLLLVLLVLVQLPKKDAGVGLAFGGGTADALFGAGSGNALTKITKWGAVSFMVIAFGLGCLQTSLHSSAGNTATFLKDVDQKQMQGSVAQPAATPAVSTTPILKANPAPAAASTTNAAK